MKFFLTQRAYIILCVLIVGFVLGYYFPAFYAISQVLTFVFGALVICDGILLFINGKGVEAHRNLDDRMSNSDENTVEIELTNYYNLKVRVKVLEELPYQFQLRDHQFQLSLNSGESTHLNYTLIPKERGVYEFGFINLLVQSTLGLLDRRIKSGALASSKVYPSYLKLRQYELAAISNQLTEVGQKKIRKIGNSLEFDNIRSYVYGDDPRHINWKATSRRNSLQVNHFVDERSQNIYCLIDKSRSMKMPFEGMILVDYAVNASLVLSFVALNKGDRAGLVSFEDKPSTFLKASSRTNQIHKITELLYAESTSFQEVDFSSLYSFSQRNLPERSLLILFTNFESLGSLKRQLPYFRLLNRKHLLLIVFFRNTEVDKLIKDENHDTEEIYQEAVALSQLTEKQLIKDTLTNHGLLSLYTSPKDLSVDVVNKYIQVKNRRLL